MNKYVNKETIKVVGDASYRIGKDIVREGTKAVLGKAAGAVVAVTLKEGFGEIKNMELDTILGDITRKQKKLDKRKKRMEKKELRKQEKINRKEKEFNESVRHGLVKEADEIIKDLGEESEEK